MFLIWLHRLPGGAPAESLYGLCFVNSMALNQMKT